MASQFLKQPFNKLNLKSSTGMHWYCYNDSVNSLNKECCNAESVANQFQKFFACVASDMIFKIDKQ